MLLAVILSNPEKGGSAEIGDLEQSVVYYSDDRETHSQTVHSRALNVEIHGEDIKINTARFTHLNEWSIPSSGISWFGGKSMAYAEIHDKVFGFTVWDDALCITPSIPGSIDSIRDEAQKLRTLAESRTILHPIKLPFQYRFPGYESMGVDNRLRIAGIEIFYDKIIIVLENRLKSKIPVTINVPEMTLGEVGEAF